MEFVCKSSNLEVSNTGREGEGEIYRGSVVVMWRYFCFPFVYTGKSVHVMKGTMILDRQGDRQSDRPVDRHRHSEKRHNVLAKAFTSKSVVWLWCRYSPLHSFRGIRHSLTHVLHPRLCDLHAVYITHTAVLLVYTIIELHNVTFIAANRMARVPVMSRKWASNTIFILRMDVKVNNDNNCSPVMNLCPPSRVLLLVLPEPDCVVKIDR